MQSNPKLIHPQTNTSRFLFGPSWPLLRRTGSVFTGTAKKIILQFRECLERSTAREKNQFITWPSCSLGVNKDPFSLGAVWYLQLINSLVQHPAICLREQSKLIQIELEAVKYTEKSQLIYCTTVISKALREIFRWFFSVTVSLFFFFLNVSQSAEYKNFHKIQKLPKYHLLIVNSEEMEYFQGQMKKLFPLLMLKC